MTDPRIAEGVKLVPDLKEDVAMMEKYPREPQCSVLHRNTIKTIISALVAAGEMVGERQRALEEVADLIESRRPKNPRSDWTRYAYHVEETCITLIQLVQSLSVAPASPGPDFGATISEGTETALKAIDDNSRNARANGDKILVGAPAPPVKGETT